VFWREPVVHQQDAQPRLGRQFRGERAVQSRQVHAPCAAMQVEQRALAGGEFRRAVPRGTHACDRDLLGRAITDALRQSPVGFRGVAADLVNGQPRPPHRFDGQAEEGVDDARAETRHDSARPGSKFIVRYGGGPRIRHDT